MTAREEVAKSRRIVVKVGSSVLTNRGVLRRRVFTEIARQVSLMREQNRDVVVVSSGAIAIGYRDLGWV